MSRKKVLFLVAVLLMPVIILGIIWFVLVGSFYSKCAKTMKRVSDEGSRIKYSLEKEGYLFQIKPAPILGFESGFLNVTKIKDQDIRFFVSDGEKKAFYNDDFGNKVILDDYYRITFYYWKKVAKESKMGIMYFTNDFSAQIMFDQDMNVLNGTESGNKELYQAIVNKHENEILDLKNAAFSLWELD